MALSLLIGFLFKGKTVIGELELDCSIKEDINFFNQVTQYPVEKGSDLTDNIRPLPERVTLNGLVTNSPLTFFSVGAVTQLIEDRKLTAYNELKRIAGRERDEEGILKPGELVTIVNGLDVFPNMALERLSIPRDANTGNALYFTGEFVRVETPSAGVTLIPADDLDSGDADLAQSGQNAGRQTATTPGTATSGRVSILKALFNPETP